MLEVDRGVFEANDFRLAVLFHGGSCVFAGAEDVAHFFRGAVARAFGIEVEPPPRPASALLDDLSPTASEHPATRSAEPGEASGPPAKRRSRRRRGTASAARLPGPEELAARLARDVLGQGDALALVARVVSTHIAKRAPAHPASVLLVGPTGTGKTTTVGARCRMRSRTSGTRARTSSGSTATSSRTAPTFAACWARR